MNPAKFFPVLLLSAALALAPTGKSAFAREKLLATTNFVGDALMKIAADDFAVTVMMPAGTDPHSYKPTAGDLRRIVKADLIFFNGLTLEAKFGEVLSRMEGKAFAVTEKIPREKLIFPNAQDSLPDPHVWFDPILWAAALERIAEVLVEKYPGKKAAIRERSRREVAKLKKMDEWIAKQIATVPKASRVLITAHDAFAYYAKRYGLELHALQGINTQTEMSLARLAEVTDLVVGKKIKAVFVENTVSPRTIEALIKSAESRGGKVKIGGELVSDSLGSPAEKTGNYAGAIRHNTQTIAKALR